MAMHPPFGIESSLESPQNVDVEHPAAQADSRPRSNSDVHQSPGKQSCQENLIKIVSATYGPSDGRRLLTGEISSRDTTAVPYTRDVLPFLRALLIARQQMELEAAQNESDEGGSKATVLLGDEEESLDPNMVRMVNTDPTAGSYIPLMNGKTMNAIFGDPCPGTSKRLNVHYVVYDTEGGARSRTANSDVHRVAFAEHERVVLRRRVTFYQDDSKIKRAVVAAARKSNNPELTSPPRSKDLACRKGGANDDDESTLIAARRMGRAQSIAEFAEDSTRPPNRNHLKGATRQTRSQATESPKSVHTCHEPTPAPHRSWRLRSAVSEIVLPMVLPFLEVRQRVRCQLVCKVWRFVVRYWGVAQFVDVNDPSFPNTRSFLRGIMTHSYSSLHSLFLDDFKELAKSDLHPALPHLRKLRSLDISCCIQLDNSTLQLISQHLNRSLEVLYMKGLRKVTDEGLLSICQYCKKLQVLEISYVPITDESGIAIGQHLVKLRALYMRDNYLLTNRSIDVITEKCTRLAQLTLWGCIRLRNLSFEQLNQTVGCGNLVMLNLWGCHSLVDEAAQSLGSMQSLRSLIVSECHRLTDAFVIGLAQNVPQLTHLHLRYCKRITDAGVNAITNSMQNIYSLDLSFCTRLSATSLANLLTIRHDTLSELRLQNCDQLEICGEQIETQLNPIGGDAGRSIVGAIRTGGDSCLSILDVRNCSRQPIANQVYPESHPFVQEMKSIGFDQRIPGFFSRPARWNPNVQQRLLNQLTSTNTIPAT